MLQRSPVCIALAALLAAIALLDGSIVAGRVRAPDLPVAPAADRSVDLVSVLLGVLVTRNLADLLLALAALLLVGPYVERLMGSRRTALAFVVTGVTGVAVGIGLQLLGVLNRGLWTTPAGGPPSAGVFTPIVGTVFTASAFAGPLWRRRIRVLGLSATVVVLLYSGQPNDLYRLLAALAGLVLGIALTRRRPRIAWPRSSHHEARSLVASLVAVTALGPFVAVVARRGYGLLRPLGLLFRDTLPGRLPDLCRAAHPPASCARAVTLARLNGPGAVLLAPLPLLVLLVAAIAIWRGRRIAALAAIAVNLLLAWLAALYYNLLPALLDPDELLGPVNGGPTLQTALAVAVPAATALVAALNLRHFDVRPTGRATLRFVATTGGVFVAVSALYVIGGLDLRTGFQPHVGLLQLLADLPERFVPVGFLRLRRLVFLPANLPTSLLYDWVGPVFWLTLLIALALASRSARTAVAGSEVELVRALLRVGSRGSLGHMASWHGNRYWFSADGRHAVAYRDVNGVGLTVGEPIGADDGALDAAREFAVHCDDIGITPVFYAVRPAVAAALSEQPWPSLVIAEDTLLSPARFSMTGKRWQDVRSSVNRADRAGVQAVWTSWAECSLAVKSQIVAISEEWVAERRLPELGFTLGGVEELRDPDVRLMLAVGPGERVEAATSWLPTWRAGVVVGWTLDFMRRRPGGLNGMVEFLIASVMSAAQQRGLEFVSLSAAPLALSGDDQSDSPLARTLAALAQILEPAYGFRSLASFKEKFQPRLEPLVLAYPDAIALPAIGVAVARAYLPEVSMPELVRLAGALR